MTLEQLLLLLGGAIASNVVLLIAASRSGALRDGSRPRLAELARPAIGPTPDRPAGRSAGMRTGHPSVGRLPSPIVPGPVAAPIPLAVTDVPARPPIDAAPGSPAPPPSPPETPPPTHEPLPTPTPQPTPEPPSAPAIPDPAPTTAAAAVPGADRPAERPARGRRGRRFVLPPIDVDHARTERVMLSLLSTDDPLVEPGAEPPTPSRRLVDAWEQLVGPERDEAADRSAIVVALTIDGLERLGESAGRGQAERIVTAVLDTLRRSARATDRVASIGRGHFRVLLVDADETVAGWFVARVRGALEPRLAAASAPVSLVAGWAEAASVGRLEEAVQQAEERRRAALLEVERNRAGQAPA